jgi:hypothetical protein
MSIVNKKTRQHHAKTSYYVVHSDVVSVRALDGKAAMASLTMRVRGRGRT